MNNLGRRLPLSQALPHMESPDETGLAQAHAKALRLEAARLCYATLYPESFTITIKALASASVKTLSKGV